jgi:hypothetical protein
MHSEPKTLEENLKYYLSTEDGADASAYILEGMAVDAVLPAMQVRYSRGGSYEFEVVNGIHRYYASVKYGYAKLPVQLVG